MTLLREAIALTLIGMGVVFASLIALMYMVRLLNRAFAEEEEEAPAPRAEEGEKGVEVALAAAAAHFLETEGPEVFIPALRRGGDSEWARRARVGALRRRPR